MVTVWRAVVLPGGTIDAAVARHSGMVACPALPCIGTAGAAIPHHAGRVACGKFLADAPSPKRGRCVWDAARMVQTDTFDTLHYFLRELF